MREQRDTLPALSYRAGPALATGRVVTTGVPNMSLFDTLKNAIFGTHSPTTPSSSKATPSSAGAQPSTPATQRSTAAAPAPASAPAQQNATPSSATHVDIEAVLNERASRRHEKLNWQSSIVDLMKLVDLDPSLENRKTLAKELGYSGNTQDSAQMNIWLHKEVMQRLAASGGKVPENLRH